MRFPFFILGIVLIVTAALTASIVVFWRQFNTLPIQGSVLNFTPLSSSAAVPVFAFHTRTKETRSLTQPTNRVILLNFWATWCAPCVHELPSLLRLQQALSNEPFELVTVSLDREGPKIVDPFLIQNDLSDLPVLFDPTTQSLSHFNLRGLPTTFLISFDGRIQGFIEGPAVWDTHEAMNLIRFYYPSLIRFYYLLLERVS